MEIRGYRFEVGSWRPVPGVGGSRLEAGGWRLEAEGWGLEVRGWRLKVKG